jgi:hypothetical protein
LLVALAAAPTHAARADDDPRARQSEVLIAEGIALREQGKDREALESFEMAQALLPSAKGTAQVALAQQALGRWVEAEAGLLRALASTSDPWIERNRGALEQALGTVRRQLAWLTVSTEAPMAELWMEGRRVATIPLTEPLRVAAGVVIVEVRAAGYEPAVRRIEVQAGVHANETLALEPLRAPDAQNVPAWLPARAPSRTAAWITAGAAAALISGGVVAHVVREQNASRYNDNSQCLAPGRSRDDVCGSYRSTVDTATVLAVIGYVTGAAAAAVSAYFFLRDEPPVRRAGVRPAGVTARCGIAPFAVACGASF